VASEKRDKIIYWTLTFILFVPSTVGALLEVFTKGPSSIVKIMLLLGYPLYLMKILGMAKVLGGVAILTGALPRMKEWAYAGFIFDWLGAAASHIYSGDAVHSIFPLAFVPVLLVTYVLWYRTAATPLPRTPTVGPSRSQICIFNSSAGS
jgi:hypothetical protein